MVIFFLGFSFCSSSLPLDDIFATKRVKKVVEGGGRKKKPSHIMFKEVKETEEKGKEEEEDQNAEKQLWKALHSEEKSIPMRESIPSTQSHQLSIPAGDLTAYREVKDSLMEKSRGGWFVLLCGCSLA